MAKQQSRCHVGKLEFSMQHHIHTHNKPTYFNIDSVEKIESATRNRRRKTTRNPNTTPFTSRHVAV